MNRKRVITILSLTVFCCLLTSTVISLFSMHRLSQEHTSEFLTTLSNEVCQSIITDLTDTINVAETVAHDKLLVDVIINEDIENQENTIKQLEKYTAGLTDTFSYSWVFIASDRTKSYYTNLGLYSIMDPDNNPDDAWYKEFVESGKEYDFTVGRDNDRPDVWTVFVDARIEDDDGTLIGVCGMALEIDDLQEVIRSYENEYNIDIIFVNSEGMPQLESSDIEYESSIIYNVTDFSNEDRITINQSLINPRYSITRYIEGLDWYMIIHDINPFEFTADFVVITVNVVIFIIVIAISVVSLFKITEGAGSLFSESYKDNMTGLYNRRAYDDNLSALIKRDSLNNITVVVFDVNGLKKVNDTQGHAAGDELIKSAALLINDNFGKYGKCYRTGGDEFVAILDKPIKDVRLLNSRFEEAQAQWKGVLINEISISYGIVNGADIDCTIDEMIFHADEQMYKRKRKYYNNTENNRRRDS